MHGRIKRLRLLGENAQPGKIVLHIRKRVEHRVAITRDGSLVCGLCGLHFGMSLSKIEHCLGTARTDRPDTIGGAK